MTLRYKFVLPINVILLVVLSGSLAWEWRRQQATGLALVKARLDEEARFVLAAFRSFGLSPRFVEFLEAFCHASNAQASPEHQVALVDADGTVLAGAAVHARRPLDPGQLATLGEGTWLRHQGREPFFVRVLVDGRRRIVVAESTRAVRAHARAGLRGQALWYLGTAVLLLGTTNAVMRLAVLRPLRRIGRAVRQLEQGQLGVEIDAPAGDELGALARRFNAMSRALAAHTEATRRELEAARQVQAQMLPPPLVTLGGLEVASRSVPRGMVGGDVCDVQPLPDGRVGLLVADLSGHDVAAALHAAMLRAFAWQEADAAASPGEVLARLNERLCRNLPEERFATAFFAVFEPDRGLLSWANAGHPPPLLWREGRACELEPTGPLLGILPEAAYAYVEAAVSVGDRLAIFSDGLPEAAAADGRPWGSGGIAEVLAASGPTATERVARVFEEAERFRGGARPEDDMTLLLVDVQAAPMAARGLQVRTEGVPSRASGTRVSPFGGTETAPGTQGGQQVGLNLVHRPLPEGRG